MLKNRSAILTFSNLYNRARARIQKQNEEVDIPLAQVKASRKELHSKLKVCFLFFYMYISPPVLLFTFLSI